MTHRFAATLSASLAAALLATATGRAEVPQILHYQGYLTNSVGEPVDCPDVITCPDATFDLTFRLYTSQQSAVALWSETHAGVGIVAGVFDAHLGSLIALDPSLLDGPRWLGVEINDTGELEPRQALRATAYAIRAAHAEDADRLGGLVPAAYATVEGLPELCVTEGNLPAVLAEIGVLGGDTDTLAGMTCLPDAMVTWDGAAWGCAHDIAPFSVTTDSLAVGGTIITGDGVATPGVAVGESTLLVDGELDLGPEVNDNLTAASVKTLTGGGDADALHTHAGLGGGGVCYTAWGTQSCGEGFTAVVVGARLGSYWTFNQDYGLLPTAECVDSEFLPDEPENGDNDAGVVWIKVNSDIVNLSWLTRVNNVTMYSYVALPCAVCCK